MNTAPRFGLAIVLPLPAPDPWKYSGLQAHFPACTGRSAGKIGGVRIFTDVVGWGLALCVALAGSASAAPPAPLVPQALAGRVVVGYQGWFGCPGDFENNTQWLHWFQGEPSATSLLVDMLPALGDFPDSALCDTGLRAADGKPVYVYSSQTAAVVDRHFQWMRDNGVTSVAVQRFVSELADAAKRRRADNVLRHVNAAALRHGVDFFITYDVSGAPAKSVIDTLIADWQHVSRDLLTIDSRAYLHADGRPVVQLWGFGFRDRPGDPGEVTALMLQLRQGGEGLKPAVLIGGVPSQWRTRSGDSKAEAGWADVYRSFDVISPWLVGRFDDALGARRVLDALIIPDLHEARRLGLGYLPVVFPGFSWHNLMARHGRVAPLDAIPRRCGEFFWAQVTQLLGAGADRLYLAMFDEFDEGTALLPVEDEVDRLPIHAALVRRSEAACALPADWYLRLAGRAARHVSERTIPAPLVVPRAR